MEKLLPLGPQIVNIYWLLSSKLFFFFFLFPLPPSSPETYSPPFPPLSHRDSPVFHHLLVENAPPGIRTHLLKIQIGTPKFGPDGDFLSTVLGKEGEGEEGEGELGVGGVKELLWDPAGERVVVVGEGRGEGGEKKSLVFLFCGLF